MDPSTLALQAVGGFVAGSLIGYALRKIARWMLIAIGFLLLPIFGLWYVGVLNVNWEAVNEVVGKIVHWLGINISNMTQALASAGALGISGAVGFVFGVSDGFRQTIAPVAPATKKYVRRRDRQ